MSLEVLVATMFQTDYSLPEKMNIQSDAIIANQCERNEVVEFDFNGYRIKYLSFAERGVGLNRTTLLCVRLPTCVSWLMTIRFCGWV